MGNVISLQQLSEEQLQQNILPPLMAGSSHGLPPGILTRNVTGDHRDEGFFCHRWIGLMPPLVFWSKLNWVVGQVRQWRRQGAAKTNRRPEDPPAKSSGRQESGKSRGISGRGLRLSARAAWALLHRTQWRQELRTGHISINSSRKRQNFFKI